MRKYVKTHISNICIFINILVLVYLLLMSTKLTVNTVTR